MPGVLDGGREKQQPSRIAGEGGRSNATRSESALCTQKLRHNLHVACAAAVSVAQGYISGNNELPHAVHVHLIWS